MRVGAGHIRVHPHAPHAHSQAVPQLLRATWRPQGPEALLQEGHCREKGAGVRGSGAPPRSPHPPGCAPSLPLCRDVGAETPQQGPRAALSPAVQRQRPRPEWGSEALGSCPSGPRPGSGEGGASLPPWSALSDLGELRVQGKRELPPTRVQGARATPCPCPRVLREWRTSPVLVGCGSRPDP